MDRKREIFRQNVNENEMSDEKFLIFFFSFCILIKTESEPKITRRKGFLPSETSFSFSFCHFVFSGQSSFRIENMLLLTLTYANNQPEYANTQ